MAPDQYAGDVGVAKQREDEMRNDSATRANALAARRDLLCRLPAGRALDHEDLVSMLDEGNQTNRAILMRKALLEYVRKQLPGGVLVTSLELDQARAAEQQDPARWRDRLSMREWPGAG